MNEYWEKIINKHKQDQLIQDLKNLKEKVESKEFMYAYITELQKEIIIIKNQCKQMEKKLKEILS